jgi:hypothetical protein
MTCFVIPFASLATIVIERQHTPPPGILQDWFSGHFSALAAAPV